MSAKALAVFSTNAGTVPTSLLAGTTTETSGSLEPVIGAVPMCACSHHAKPGVTQTTPGADRTPKPLENAGLQESDGRADTPLDRRSPWEFCPESGWKLYWRSMVEQVQPVQPVPRGRRLLARLCLFAFCGGLLLLLSSRPAEAAERREPGLLDPVSTTLEATAREVLLAGRATGSGASTAGDWRGPSRGPGRQAGRPGGHLPGPPGRAPDPSRRHGRPDRSSVNRRCRQARSRDPD